MNIFCFFFQPCSEYRTKEKHAMEYSRTFDFFLEYLRFLISSSLRITYFWYKNVLIKTFLLVYANKKSSVKFLKIFIALFNSQWFHFDFADFRLFQNFRCAFLHWSNKRVFCREELLARIFCCRMLRNTFSTSPRFIVKNPRFIVQKFLISIIFLVF